MDEEIEDIGFGTMQDDEVFIVVEDKNFVTQRKKGGWDRHKTKRFYLHK